MEENLKNDQERRADLSLLIMDTDGPTWVIVGGLKILVIGFCLLQAARIAPHYGVLMASLHSIKPDLGEDKTGQPNASQHSKDPTSGAAYKPCHLGIRPLNP